MKTLKQAAQLVVVNAVILYALLFGGNAFMACQEQLADYQKRRLVELEAIRSAQDQDYYYRFLRTEYPQLIHPNLFDEGPNEAFARAARTHGFWSLGSQPHAQVSYCNEGYGFTIYKTDRYGFRNPDTNWDKTVDVLLIGDSYAQGACVGEQDHISAQLTKGGLNTVTTGSGSNHPLHYAALAKVLGRIAKPKHMVMIFYPNDNTELRKDNPYYQQYFETGNHEFGYGTAGVSSSGVAVFEEAAVILRKHEEERFKQLGLAQKEQSYNEALARSAHQILSEPSSHVITLTWRDLVYLRKVRTGWQGILKALHADGNTDVLWPTRLAIETLVEQCQAPCSPTRQIPLPYNRSNSASRNGGAILYAEKHGVPSIDSTSVLAELGPAAYAPLGPHLSKEGYRRVTELVLEGLRSPR
jgi:hypothetical protein